MDKDNQQRRVKKVTGDAAHRTGEKRAAVKPHKVSGTSSGSSTTAGAASASSAAAASASTAASHAASAATQSTSTQSTSTQTVTIKQVIYQYMNSLRGVTLSQSAWGDAIAPVASVLQANYGLAANDEPYFLNDPTGTSTGKAGLLLSTTGIHLSDGKGGRVGIAWKDLKKLQVGYQQGMLVIGQNGIQTSDGQVIAALLQYIQSKLA
ncbi:MAG: hypothetical protein IJ125_06040 [Atopobiaceae bacterium]|nr:hypothetical protein [Atopobiaceae bacterium]